LKGEYLEEYTKRVGDREKNGRILFDRPKPTAGCSVNGRRRRMGGMTESIVRK
jgi:hypothetical protein